LSCTYLAHHELESVIIVVIIIISGSHYPAGQEAWEGFFMSPDPQQAVSLSAHELNFGSCSRLSPGGHKTLTVTNATNAKVTAFLVVPGWQGLSSQSQMQQVFQVGWSCALSWNAAEKKRKDYAFWRQFNEKPRIILGCPVLE